MPITHHNQAERNQQAKAWLSAAGYGPQNPLQLNLLYNTSDNNQQISVAVASMWKKTLGVKVSLVNQEWKTYIGSRQKGDFDVIRASWVGDYNEPSTFLNVMTSGQSSNITGYNNPEYNQLLTRAKKETDDAKRTKDYIQAEQIIARDVPVAPIYQYTNGRLIKPWVKGYPIQNPNEVVYSRELWIEQH